MSTPGRIARRTQIVGPDNPRYQISKDEWNAGLVVDSEAPDGSLLVRDRAQADGWGLTATLPDSVLDLSYVARTNRANFFTQPQIIQFGSNPYLALNDIAQPPGSRWWEVATFGAEMKFRATADLGAPPVVDALRLTRSGNAIVAGTLTATGGLANTPLNADNLTTGTVPIARLPPTLAYTDRGNVFTQPQIIQFGSNPYLALNDIAQPVGSKWWEVATFGTEMRFRATADLGAPPVVDALRLTRSGNAIVVGTLTAPGGLATTPLNADNLTTGTVPVARLPATVAYTNISNVFTQPQYIQFGSSPHLALIDPGQAVGSKWWQVLTFNTEMRFRATQDAGAPPVVDALRLTRTGNATVVGTLTAPGGLATTPLNASNLLSGTVPDARLSANVQMKPVNLATDVVGVLPPANLPPGGVGPHHATHEAGGSDAITSTGELTVAGALIVENTIYAQGHIEASGNISAAGVVTALGGLNGTPLNASQLTTGTVPDARLSANVQMKPVNLASDVVGQLPPGSIAAGSLPAHHTLHEPGGSDALAVDAVATTGSLRTLGLGPQQAAPGNDARFTAPRTPTAHATTHNLGGSDVLTVTALGGFPGGTTGFLRADGTFATPPGGAVLAHHTTHEAGGSDALALDLLAAPTDVTTLNATITAHGLLPKLSGNPAHFLSGVGSWLEPGGGSGGGTGDVIGPSSATHNAIALFDGTTGKAIKDSTVLLPLAASHIVPAGNNGAIQWNDGGLLAGGPAEMLVSDPSHPMIRLRSVDGTFFTWGGASLGLASSIIAGSGSLVIDAGADYLHMKAGSSEFGLEGFCSYIGNGGELQFVPGPLFGASDFGLKRLASAQGQITDGAWGGLGSLEASYFAADHLRVGLNPAQSGALRLANSAGIWARNAANTTDLRLLIAGAGNETVIGSFAGTSTTVDAGTEVVLRAEGATALFYFSGLGAYPGADGTRHLGWTTLRWKQVHVAESVNIGTNPAQSGSLRLPCEGWITVRNAANNADIPLFATDTNDNVGFAHLSNQAIYIGSGSNPSINLRALAVNCTGTLNAADLGTTPLNATNLTSGTMPMARIAVSAASRLLGRGSSGSGAMEEITLGAGLLMTGTVLSASGGGGAHHTTHEPGGADAMAVDAAAITGSLRTLGGGPLQAASGTDARFFDARFPQPHNATHKANGADQIRLDEFQATTDTVALNATATAHGLLPKLSNNAANYLNGQGTWVTPSFIVPAAHHTTHEPGGTDVLLNVAWTNVANTFTQSQTISDDGWPRLTMIESSQPANLRRFVLSVYQQECYLEAVNDLNSVAGTPLRMTRVGDVAIGRNLTVNGLHEVRGNSASVQLIDTAQSANAKNFALANRNQEFQIRTLDDAGQGLLDAVRVKRDGSVEVANTLTVGITPLTVKGLGVSELRLTDESAPAENRTVRLLAFQNMLQFWTATDGLAGQGIMRLDRSGNTYINGAFFERGRSTAMGDWTGQSVGLGPYALSPGTTGFMTWSLSGKTLTVTVAGQLLLGAPLAFLTLTLPGGYRAYTGGLHFLSIPMFCYNQVGWEPGFVLVTNDSASLELYRNTQATWTAVNTYYGFSFSIPIV